MDRGYTRAVGDRLISLRSLLGFQLFGKARAFTSVIMLTIHLNKVVGDLSLFPPRWT